MSPNSLEVSRPVARIAAQWFIRLQHDQPTDQERQAFEAWRLSSEEHDRAWQLAGELNHQFQALPKELSVATLERPSLISRRTALGGITSLIVLASLGVGVPRTRAFNALTAGVRSQVGEIRHLTLSDGSEITLNSDSALDVQYTDTTRKLILRKGELFIAAAPDARPMVVESAYGAFNPVGTQFSIGQFDDYDLLYVREGRVNASVLGKPETLVGVAAGGQVRVSATKVATDESSVSTDWVNGVLRANRMRLADLLIAFARYRQGWIRCAPEVADLPISGVFQLNDIDAALAALAMSFPVQVRYMTRYWVTVVSV
ncbi:FecR domain-containing protein [Pseudomonas syringae]|uniref:FecR domain-containing protein n=1 Tax=Pseudomonas syringae TaxID=317 RepID=UPI00215A3698|nr:FecR domain-containing protein [Pseudomonas syringae]MCR8718246.1 FecR domain-containing protein [Pseudomonas syringae]